MNDIEITIIEKIKKFLNIQDDISEEELYDLLYNYRNQNHPDNFEDEDNKERAEEIFKEGSLYLAGLAKYIEEKKLRTKPNQLININEKLEKIKAKQKTVNLEEENEKLKKDNEYLRYKINKLVESLKKKYDKKIDNLKNELISRYKPNKNSLIPLGLTFSLSILLMILTKIDAIINILREYSPIDANILNATVFYVFIVILALNLLLYIKRILINNNIKKITTIGTINRLSNYLTENELEEKFGETDIYRFVKNKLFNSKLKEFMHVKIFRTMNEYMVNHYTEIIIYTLLNRRLIDISRSQNLERLFKVNKNYIFVDLDGED